MVVIRHQQCLISAKWSRFNDTIKVLFGSLSALDVGIFIEVFWDINRNLNPTNLGNVSQTHCKIAEIIGTSDLLGQSWPNG